MHFESEADFPELLHLIRIAFKRNYNIADTYLKVNADPNSDLDNLLIITTEEFQF
jgi:hypothetical protein